MSAAAPVEYDGKVRRRVNTCIYYGIVALPSSLSHINLLRHLRALIAMQTLHDASEKEMNYEKSAIYYH